MQGRSSAIWLGTILICFAAGVQAAKDDLVTLPDQITGAGELWINADSKARDTLRSIPPEAALERFTLLDGQGRHVAYAGLTEGEVGGVVFVDDRLVGTLTHDDALLFYSCRGFVSAMHQHWAMQSPAWAESLLAAARPASEALLRFSGKSTTQSIKSVVDNPLVVQVKAIAGAGANPVEMVKTLYKAHGDYRDHERDKQHSRALNDVRPGMSEAELVQVLPPESVTFLDAESLVMAYPRFSVEFFVTQGKVREIQQPAFSQLVKERASLFYQYGVDWKRCTPEAWREAKVLPAAAVAASAQ
jgi:hypothetical protein